MLLTGKVVVIFSGSGVIGSAVAQAMARKETHVCLGAHSQEKLDRTASIIRTASGTVEASITDVLDEHSTSKEITRLVGQAGEIDVVVNATGFMHGQGRHIDALSFSEFMGGITPFPSVQLSIAKAVAPHMGGSHVDVILDVVTPAAPMTMPGHLGHIVGCAGIEASIRAFASEAGPVNIQVVGVHLHVIVDAVAADSYIEETFSTKAQSMGLTVDQQLEGTAQSTMLVCLPTLAQIAEVMTFLTSDHASAMTATVMNIAGGAAHS